MLYGIPFLTIEKACFNSLLQTAIRASFLLLPLATILSKSALQARLYLQAKQFIHHSDRGIQYCSNVYTQILKRKKINISMTEENHCYENTIAEQVNGILKNEFYLDQTFDNVAQAKRATKNAIN